MEEKRIRRSCVIFCIDPPPMPEYAARSLQGVLSALRPCYLDFALQVSGHRCLLRWSGVQARSAVCSNKDVSLCVLAKALFEAVWCLPIRMGSFLELKWKMVTTPCNFSNRENDWTDLGSCLFLSLVQVRDFFFRFLSVGLHHLIYFGEFFVELFRLIFQVLLNFSQTRFNIVFQIVEACSQLWPTVHKRRQGTKTHKQMTQMIRNKQSNACHHGV